ncbi:MAG: hypothetical protein MI861_29265 [Pirellulales bacterium]|nr:hypothetical protein [Pirellulales bacterium]
MKKYLFIILTVLLLAGWGCGSPNDSGTVTLDGPILESVDREGNLEFNGAVVNNGDEPVSSIYVVIILKDQQGNIVEANSESVFEEGAGYLLFPGERAFFSVTLDADTLNVFSKEVEIYYDDEGQIPPPS